MKDAHSCGVARTPSLEGGNLNHFLFDSFLRKEFGSLFQNILLIFSFLGRILPVQNFSRHYLHTKEDQGCGKDHHIHSG